MDYGDAETPDGASAHGQDTMARGSAGTKDTSQSLNNELPPEYDGTTDYNMWKKLHLWTKYTRTPPELHGGQSLESPTSGTLKTRMGPTRLWNRWTKRLLPEEETDTPCALG